VASICHFWLPYAVSYFSLYVWWMKILKPPEIDTASILMSRHIYCATSSMVQVVKQCVCYRNTSHSAFSLSDWNDEFPLQNNVNAKNEIHILTGQSRSSHHRTLLNELDDRIIVAIAALNTEGWIPMCNTSSPILTNKSNEFKWCNIFLQINYRTSLTF
jgi:hypothetical protein